MIVSSTFERLLMLFCCLALGMLAASSTHGQGEQIDNKPARSVVRGRVLFADSEQPVRRAAVRLRQEFNKRFLKRVVSGRRGDFSFHNVPAGTYYVDVDEPGVVSQTNGIELTDFGLSIEDSSVVLVTVDGVNEVKTEVRVTRGGAITGRISYGDGEPAIRARIVLYRQNGGTPALFFARDWGFTDDRGVFRVEGLPPGEYFVGAVENNAGGSDFFPRDSAGLVTAYHPATTSINAATVVSVQAGTETRDVNIKLVEEPRRISGKLKWKQINAPVKNATIFLRRIGDPQPNVDVRQFLNVVTPSTDFDNTAVMMRDAYFLSLLSTNAPYIEAGENGSWSFSDLTAGTYSLSVMALLPDQSASARSRESPDDLDPDTLASLNQVYVKASTEVTIKDKDVENIVIELSEGGRIAGSVMIEGDSSAPVSVLVIKVPAGPPSLIDIPARVDEDGTFVARSVPAGAVRLDITESRGSNYYVRSITGKGIDLLNEPLTLTEGEQVIGVQIVLGTDLATVEGRVVAPRGEGVAGAGVVFVPVDQRRRNIRSMWKLARANAEGRFSMRLAPGDYFAFSWSLANEPKVPLESYVRTPLPNTRRLTLQPKETRNVELTAPARPEP